MHALRRLLPRAHLLSEHGRWLADADLPLLSLAAALCQRAPVRWWGSGASGRSSLDDNDYAGNVLTLPSDLSQLEALGQVEPRLREVVAAHQATLQSEAQQPLREALEAALAGSRHASLGRSALRALRVTSLRSALRAAGADEHGTKEELLQRVLGLLEAEGAAAAAARPVPPPGIDALPDGVLTPRAVRAAARRAAIAAGAAPEPPAGRLRRPDGLADVITAQEVAELLLEAHGRDVVVIDVRGRCAFTDWMVVATAVSPAAARAAAGAVLRAVKARCAAVAPGVAPSLEGLGGGGGWLLVDAGSVVVHVLEEGERAEYDLEGLWGGPGGTGVSRPAPMREPPLTLRTLR